MQDREISSERGNLKGIIWEEMNKQVEFCQLSLSNTRCVGQVKMELMEDHRVGRKHEELERRRQRGTGSIHGVAVSIYSAQ